MKKLIAPLVITAILLIYLAVYLILIVTWIPYLALQILLGAIPALSAAVLIGVLVERIKEIRSGEENDLSQY